MLTLNHGHNTTGKDSPVKIYSRFGPCAQPCQCKLDNIRNLNNFFTIFVSIIDIPTAQSIACSNNRSRDQERELQMSDGNASDDSSRNKRTSFTDMIPKATAAKPLDPTQSLLGVAKKAVDAYVRMLQPMLATIVVNAADDYLLQRAMLFYKQRKFDQMRIDVALILRSSQVELTLKASPKVKKGQEY